MGADVEYQHGEREARSDATQKWMMSSTTNLAILLLLTVIGFLLRVAGLGQAPLSDSEAIHALAALRVYQPELGVFARSQYSPIAVSIGVFMFWLSGATQFAARFGPALLGTLMIPLPYGLRHHLGRSGALVASTLLAFSPLFLLFSRTVNGEMATVLGSFAFLVGAVNWSTPADRRPLSAWWFWPGLCALGAAVMLASAPATYSFLLIAATSVVLLPLAREDIGTLWCSLKQLFSRDSRPGLLVWILALLSGLLVFAAAGFFNYEGFIEAGSLPWQWIQGFKYRVPIGHQWQPALPVYPVIFSVALYEPLLLLAGLMGAAVAIVRRRPVDLLLVWWFFASLALDLFRPGRADGEVLIALLPLILLAGLALGQLWDSLRRSASWQREGIVVLAGLVIAGYTYIQLMMFARTGGSAWFLPIAAFVLFIALTIVVAMLNDTYTALRSSATTAVICLGMFAVATAARLNYTAAIPARQTVITTPATLGLFDLDETLRSLSSSRAGDPFLVDIVATRDSGPAVEWLLYRFPNVIWLDSAEQLRPGYAFEDAVEAAIASAQAFVTPGTPQIDGATGFVGQDFAVRTSWSPFGLSERDMIRWVVLRTANTPVTSENIVLWVRQ
jgi:predicted membrane-bound mannosyltransferase